MLDTHHPGTDHAVANGQGHRFIPVGRGTIPDLPDPADAAAALTWTEP